MITQNGIPAVEATMNRVEAGGDGLHMPVPALLDAGTTPSVPALLGFIMLVKKFWNDKIHIPQPDIHQPSYFRADNMAEGLTSLSWEPK